jgi:hypothetical protein
VYDCESTDIIAASEDDVRRIDFDGWPGERSRFAPIEGPDFLTDVELGRLEEILTARTDEDIPIALETIPPPSEPPESESEPIRFASPVRSELRDLLAALPPERLTDMGREWAAIDEFGRLPEQELTEWFVPFFEQLVALARAARDDGRNLFVVHWG